MVRKGTKKPVMRSQHFPSKRGMLLYPVKVWLSRLSQKYEETWKALFQEADRVSENLDGESIGGKSLEMKVNQSLLKHGYFLYIMLQKKVDDNSRRWEIINDVWVEMLAYAAQTCEWKQHAQQLRRGGELLTHVCLFERHTYCCS
ncbi:hypothetical protein Dsin_014325 [Dipteronia sinensis]|uniref:Uncharacterized protein n=1 Tax=Dipteronia sinensis TaxID=43782 RepID=A0AAE0AMB7_9ROSI|nr:hypothetical protein Dsin_014325 [Dipteronia sinensis]